MTLSVKSDYVIFTLEHRYIFQGYEALEEVASSLLSKFFDGFLMVIIIIESSL